MIIESGGVFLGRAHYYSIDYNKLFSWYFLLFMLFGFALFLAFNAADYLLIVIQVAVVMYIITIVSPKLTKTSKNDYFNPGFLFISFIGLNYILSVCGFFLFVTFNRYIPNEIINVGWVNIIVIVFYLTGYLLFKKNHNAESNNDLKKNLLSSPNAIWLFCFFSVAYLWGVLSLYGDLYSAINSFMSYQIQDARLEYSAGATGFVHYALKQVYNVVGLLCIVYIFYKNKDIVIYKVIKFLLVLITVISICLLFLYGGRFLPFSLFLFVVLLFNRMNAPYTKKVIVFTIIFVFSLFVSFAALRYTTYSAASMDMQALTDSFIRQAMNENAELAISLPYVDKTIYRKLLTEDFIDSSVPRIIYKYIYGTDKSLVFTDVSPKFYLAVLLNRVASGGIRVGAHGDLYLSFGYFGIAIYYCIIGIVMNIMDKMYLSNNYVQQYVSIFFVVQLLFMQIIGFTNIIPSIILTVFTYVTFGFLRLKTEKQ